MTEPVSRLRSAIESILLVVDEPAPVEAIARALDASEGDVRAELDAIGEELRARGSGAVLRGGEEGYRLYTSPDNAEAVEAFLVSGSRSRLSRAALETLAVVAYRQPATRAQVAAVRGVNVDGVMRTLNQRGLIRETEEPEGHARRYETTALFLEQLGISSLEELPDLAPLLPDVDLIDEEDE